MTNDPRIVTLIGGGGFIGHYVAEALLKRGVRLRVAQRRPKRAHDLQPLGNVGQVMLMAADIRNRESIARAVQGADAVVNLVGTFDIGQSEALHAEGARIAAEEAAKAGAKAFVQLSAIGADPHASSVYASTKGKGEEAVRKAFPGATILRPSTVFGTEDEFTNRFAQMAGLPILPVIAPATKFQPVFVRDLAEAIAKAALEPETYAGTSFDIGGPEVMTMRQLNEKVAAMAGRDPEIVEVPDFIASGMASLGFLPGAPLTRDQWAMLQSDNVCHPDCRGLKAFGVPATAMEDVAPRWLSRYRSGGRFAVSA
ncbi:complex I NDUFA9 subunit family protein [Sphingomicrobium nitratireducens]|uniref:complex I NDUFA9 subunit family protein n=1 Tax=Sphingomicrobium nitratireducens TaxID=2964666 RepID=UPI00224051DD|nr:complex I NDUFA9 subunit family protein [Sphingomicrobium nitratireducens]